MIARLVQDLVGPSPLHASFAKTLEIVASPRISSSISLLKPIADLAVADGPLLQRQFSRHSVSELATSKTLEGVAATLKPVPLRDEILRHARDELRHSRMFGALARNLSKRTDIPVQSSEYSWILENDEKFVEHYRGDVVEFICDLLAGEVRTHGFIATYIDALEEEGSAYSMRAAKVLRRILADELRHIGYTARYVNTWMTNGLDLSQYLQKTFKEFDKNSWIAIGAFAQIHSQRQ